MKNYTTLLKIVTAANSTDDMEEQRKKIREQQRTTWNKFSPGLKKWDQLFMDFLKPMGDEIIERLDPKNGDFVLDVAAGTGEPGLTIASMLNGGRVILTDISENMLDIARENAQVRGLKNVDFLVCDVCELPFPDDSFDAISCRFGFMFFPDMPLAAKEMARVLKPGGRLATSVWNVPDKNFWVVAITEAIKRNMEWPVLSGEAPGMFSCAGEGFISDLLIQAGLNNIHHKQINCQLACGTAETYWELLMDVAAPMVSPLHSADHAVRHIIKSEVYQVLERKFPGGDIRIDASALVISAEKLFFANAGEQNWQRGENLNLAS